MTVILDENFIAMWQFELPDREGNFLGSLHWKQSEDKKELAFTYRFRYYLDDLNGPESKDEKHWYEVIVLDHDASLAIQKMRVLIDAIAQKAGTTAIEILMDERGPMAVMERMRALPCFHMQEVPHHEA